MRKLAERAIGAAGVAERAPARRSGRSVTVNLAESPLTWLHARGMISGRQFDAGERLRADWECAGLGPRVTMDWASAAAPSRTRRGAPPALDPTLVQLSAKGRFDAALATAGPGLSDVLWRVVCAGEGLATAEKGLGWPSRAAKLVLGLALDRVADYYRLPGGRGPQSV